MSSLTAALWADLSATSHVLIRLRILHPVFAASAAIAIVLAARRLAEGQGPPAARLARAVSALAVVRSRWACSRDLLAPVWLQLAHLLVADAVWIALILLGASVLGRPARALRHTPPSDGRRAAGALT